MAKPNYQFEKRQRDLAKKSKQEEKRRQKLAGKAIADESGSGAANPPLPMTPDASGEADSLPDPGSTSGH
jgi:hypothetical protein